MQQAAVNIQQLVTSQLPKLKFNGDNRLQFLSGFPEVAAHFGFTELIDNDPPLARPIPNKGNHEEVYEWDRLNNLVLGKLFKVSFA